MNFKNILNLTLMLFTAASLHAQDYDLVWSDEFNTNTLGTNWNVEVTEAPYNNELEAYTANPDNVSITGGNLVITARREDYGSRAFTSGRVNSLHKVAFTHGKIEARIKMPRLADGLWPAFWMMGDDFDQVNWPKCGEIDILEMGSKEAQIADATASTVSGAIHWGESISNPQHYTPGGKTLDQDLTEGYHTYTCLWDNDYIRFYVDNSNEPYFEATIKKGFSRSAYFHKPYFIILNLAVGGDYTGITNPEGITALPADGSEAKMYVDYVRIYQKKDQHNITTGIKGVARGTRTTDGKWYDISGSPATCSGHGIIVCNGQKTIRHN